MACTTTFGFCQNPTQTQSPNSSWSLDTKFTISSLSLITLSLSNTNFLLVQLSPVPFWVVNRTWQKADATLAPGWRNLAPGLCQPGVRSKLYIQPIRFELCLIEPIGVVQKPLGNTERHTENMECWLLADYICEQWKSLMILVWMCA